MQTTYKLADLFANIEKFTSAGGQPLAGRQDYHDLRKTLLSQVGEEIGVNFVPATLLGIIQLFGVKNYEISWGYTPNPPPVRTMHSTSESLRTSQAAMVYTLLEDGTADILHLESAEVDDNYIFSRVSDGSFRSLNEVEMKDAALRCGFFFLN